VLAREREREREKERESEVGTDATQGLSNAIRLMHGNKRKRVCVGVYGVGKRERKKERKRERKQSCSRCNAKSLECCSFDAFEKEKKGVCICLHGCKGERGKDRK